jgi:PHD/YefM family antitoxin component YafN of YafNO toxin-antitoxin module
MPKIIPIRDLKDTSAISEACRVSEEPIFVTKNGYGDMVIMSMDVYERTMFLLKAHEKITAAEAQVQDGETFEASESLKKLHDKFHV